MARPDGGGELEALILQVVSQHPSVRMESSFVEAARADVDAADLSRFPTLSVQTQNSGPKPSTQISVEQPLWAGGRIQAQRDLARVQETLQQAQLRDVQYQLALRVVDAWVVMLQSDEKSSEVEARIQKLQTYQSMMRRRVDAQVSPRVELALIDSRTLSARVELQEMRTASNLARGRLQQLLGAEPQRDTAQSSRLDLASMAQSTPEVVSRLINNQAESLERHPTLGKAQAQAMVARHQLEIQQAARWPEVYMRAQHNAGSAAVPGERSVFFGLRYQPGAGLSSLALSRAAAQRAQGQAFAVDVARRDLQDAVHVDLEGVSNAKLRADGLQRAVETSALVMASYERQFVAGKRSWQEVLNAARENGDNRTALVDARAALVHAVYRLRVRLSDLDWQRAP